MLGRSFFLTEKDTKYFEYMQSLQGERELIDNAPTRFITLEEFQREARNEVIKG